MKAQNQESELSPASPAVFLEREFFINYEANRRLSEQALAQFGPTPQIVWGYLRFHIYECRFTNPENEKRGSQTEISQTVRLAFGMLDYLDNRKLSRALSRLSCITAATLALETEPDAETLAKAEAWLDTYEELQGESSEDYELWCSDTFYQQARVRVMSWKLAKKKSRNADSDFAFVADCLYPSDLEWAMDPVVVLDDFQEWARKEIVERNVTRASIFRKAIRTNSFNQVPQNNMMPIVIGRLLAAQLIGVN